MDKGVSIFEVLLLNLLLSTSLFALTKSAGDCVNRLLPAAVSVDRNDFAEHLDSLGHFQVTLHQSRHKTFNAGKTIYNIQYTIYNIQYTIYNIQYTIYNIQYTIHNIQYTI